jgi:hypothetical protein
VEYPHLEIPASGHSFVSLFDASYKAEISPADLARLSGMKVAIVDDYIYNHSVVVQEDVRVVDDPDLTRFFQGLNKGEAVILHRTRITYRLRGKEKPYIVRLAFQKSTLDRAIRVIGLKTKPMHSLSTLFYTPEHKMPSGRIIVGYTSKPSGEWVDGYFDDSQDFLYQLYPRLVEANLLRIFNPLKLNTLHPSEKYEAFMKAEIIRLFIHDYLNKKAKKGTGFLIDDELADIIKQVKSIPAGARVFHLFGSVPNFVFAVARQWADERRGHVARNRLYACAARNMCASPTIPLNFLQMEVLERTVLFLLSKFVTGEKVVLHDYEEVTRANLFPNRQKLLGVGSYKASSSKIFKTRSEFLLALREIWNELFGDYPDLLKAFRFYHFSFKEVTDEILIKTRRDDFVDAYVDVLERETPTGERPVAIDNLRFVELGMPFQQ